MLHVYMYNLHVFSSSGGTDRQISVDNITGGSGNNLRPSVGGFTRLLSHPANIDRTPSPLVNSLEVKYVT